MQHPLKAPHIEASLNAIAPKMVEARAAGFDFPHGILPAKLEDEQACHAAYVIRCVMNSRL
jgi:hypothetical protein